MILKKILGSCRKKTKGTTENSEGVDMDVQNLSNEVEERLIVLKNNSTAVYEYYHQSAKYYGMLERSYLLIYMFEKNHQVI